MNKESMNISPMRSEEPTYQFTKQHIFISGSLATGKTSVMKWLNEYLRERDDVSFIKEYIDFDVDGEKYLERLYHGEISNYQFQLYVLSCYEKQLNTLDFEEADVIVWERHPLEALNIFCKDDTTLTEKERSIIMLKIESMCDKYKIPKLFEKNINYIHIDTIFFGIEQISYFILSEIIYQMLLGEYVNDVFILLFCSNNQEQLNRILRRERTIELDMYKTKDDLLKINNKYFEFYLRRKDSK
ncbi:deoxyuridine 5'-triphosphate nucleotidohydrolase domain containing protein [Entamoeba histolytica HM-1:IMSS-B]|uniref:Deoxyuridine 5'-triphosphate nucleotidohydrolase domain containing protein n=3 Tax=Entamoeba histolytica TaxID=5759 RepID=M3US59_ENTH1|nr:deoxyuridine 5'-triphosphate nucleotidohydrolase domain containing protein [Entamoeba histolytica HM-1:IMSS-B]EMS12812.1 hypothetical protein KM1_229640 [Entamoeba histolytica HM-3:IMSS]ENY62246.1 hypothetical protein EHI7A_129080 [Entamoeba histolytica HM-1:IMSS-A]